MAKRGASNTTGLGNLSVGALQAELRRRERSINKLIRKRDRLAAQLQALDAELTAIGGVRGAGGLRRRPKNTVNLVDALAKLLTGKTMNVTEAAEKVQQQGGYQTTSSNFRTIVNQTLINSGKFKRMGRGVYTAKG